MAIRTNKKTVTVSYGDIPKFIALFQAMNGGTIQTTTTARKEKAKFSLNNPYVVYSDELGNKTTVEVKEGDWAHFSNPDFKSGRANGYNIVDLRTAQEKFVAGHSDEICAKTGVKMALVGDYKISETLVKIAEAKNLL